MKKERSYRVFTIYALIFQFMILVSLNSKVENLSVSSIEDYTIRDATVQVLISYSSGGNSIDPYSEVSYSGTGTVIHSDNGEFYVITVRHVCTPQEDIFLAMAGLTREIDVMDISGNQLPAEIVLVDDEDDLCMIKYNPDDNYFTTPAEVSSRAAYLDEEVYMYGAPSGFYVPSAITQFQGVSAGNAKINMTETAVYTIPATGGSSGAAVINSDGKIVGILHSTLADFHHISLATPHSSMLRFINEVELLTGLTFLD